MNIKIKIYYNKYYKNLKLNSNNIIYIKLYYNYFLSDKINRKLFN